MDSPLIVTRDEVLRDELLRLSAAAGVLPEVAADPGAALAPWARASLVLVGADCAGDLARLAPPRRAGVHVLARGRTEPEVFRHAVGLGAEAVSELPASDGWLLEVLADAIERPERAPCVVAVVAGSGGAGATTFACVLGLVAARRGPACLVDTDPLGPGVDRVLGLDRLDGARWPALEQTTGRISARSLRESLPQRDGLGVLTWGPEATRPVPGFALRHALEAAGRGHEVVVVDVPRSAALDPEVLVRADLVVVVARASVPGVAAAARLAGSRGGGPRTGLVLRGRGVDAVDAAALVGLPLLASLPEQRGLAADVDLGLGPLRSRRGALAVAAREVLACARAGDPGAR